MELSRFETRLIVPECQARMAMAGDVPLDPLPLDVRRAREAGIATRTCGHVFPLTSFSLSSIGRIV